MAENIKTTWHEYDIYSDDKDVDEDEAAAISTCLGLFQTAKDNQLVEMEYPISIKTTRNLSSEDEKECSFSDHEEENDEIVVHKNLVLKCYNDWTHSTGVAISRGSDVMANHLMEYAHLVRNRSVLELGAGVGLVGLVAHHLGAAKVVWTDGDDTVLNILQQNIAQNYNRDGASRNKDRGNEEDTESLCRQLVWGKNLDEFVTKYGTFDVIFGVDICYIDKSMDPLFRTVDRLLSNDGIYITIHAAYAQSPLPKTLERACQDFGLVCSPDLPSSLSSLSGAKDWNNEQIYILYRRRPSHTV